MYADYQLVMARDSETREIISQCGPMPRAEAVGMADDLRMRAQELGLTRVTVAIEAPAPYWWVPGGLVVAGA